MAQFLFRDVTKSGLKTLFKIAAGQDVSGGMAGVKLAEQGYVSDRQNPATRQRFYGYDLTDKGRTLVADARRAGL